VRLFDVTAKRMPITRERVNLPGILPARWDWSSALGNFVLNFGALDYFVFVFLKDNLPPDAFQKTRDMHFKDRVLKIAEILRARGASSDQQAAYTSLLARIEPLRDLRNSIAHGHLHVRVPEDGSLPVVTLFNPKDLDLSEYPEVKLEEVLNASTELHATIAAFEKLTGFTEKAVELSEPMASKMSMTSMRQKKGAARLQ